MKTTVTTGQLAKFLELLDQKGVTPETFQDLLSKGVLSDIFESTANFQNRDQWRKSIGLASLVSEKPAEEWEWKFFHFERYISTSHAYDLIKEDGWQPTMWNDINIFHELHLGQTFNFPIVCITGIGLHEGPGYEYMSLTCRKEDGTLGTVSFDDFRIAPEYRILAVRKGTRD